MKKGFTLVELLVVIGIVVALAGLLFGVFGTAKATAKTSACASNLHQIGMATGLYNNDNDGRFPATVNYIERAAPQVMLGRPQEVDPKKFSTPKTALHGYIKAAGVLQCPQDKGGSVLDIDKNAPLHTVNEGVSYLFADLIDGQNPLAWKSPSREVWAVDASNAWHDPSAQTEISGPGLSNKLHYDFSVSKDKYSGVSSMETKWPD